MITQLNAIAFARLLKCFTFDRRQAEIVYLCTMTGVEVRGISNSD
ncbi:MAG: hypothetical protein AAFR62_15535 [Cyanobacteria bacterium J06629_2]